MPAPFTSIVRLSVVVTAGLTASLAAGQGGGTGTSSGWKQHDSNRTKPRIVQPAEPLAAGRAPKAP